MPLSHSPVNRDQPRRTAPGSPRPETRLSSDRGAGKCQSTRVFERERASPAFGHDWTHNLTRFTGLQVAFRVPIKCDDDMIGHWQFQAGFKLSAEDLPVRLSATTS
jgi:hypothetical protein